MNQPASDFQVKTTHGDRALADYRGRWLILFSHPADFTPVCTTEFIAFANAVDAFRDLNCDVLALSIDSPSSHLAWTRNVQEKFGTQIPFRTADAAGRRIGEGCKATGWYHSTRSL